MNDERRTHLHIAAVAWLLVLVLAWLWLSVWLFVLITKQPFYPLAWQDIAQFWLHGGSLGKPWLQARVAVGFGALVCGMLGLFEIYKERRSLHGDARFATFSEIKKAGLLAKKGILIGKAYGKYLVSGGQDFTLLAAPTRSGKGVSMVVPNLLNWPESVICMDTKLENFYLTSGYRHTVLKQDVFLFAPFSEDCRTHRWNPLDEVRRNPVLMSGDVLQIAQIFYPERAGDKNPFFTMQAQNLFFGLTLFLLESGHPNCSLAEVFRQGSGYDKPLREHLHGLLEEHPNLSRQCRDALNRFMSNPDETFGNIKASFDAPLLIFANPLVEMATSASDFRVSDVRKRRMSVYFGVTPNRLVQAERLINLFFTQVITLNTETLPEDDAALRYQCLLMNDEFTAFGRIPVLVKAVSFIAGYNLRLVTIVQSKTQLQGDNLYSAADARNLIVNHDVKVAYTPGDDQEAKEVSEMLGTYTMKATSVSSNRNTSVLVANPSGSAGENTSDQRRALMMAGELKRLSLKQEIIDKKGLRPILCQKVLYYEDPIFVGRLKQVSPMLAEIPGHVLSKDEIDRARFAHELCTHVTPLQLPPTHPSAQNKASAGPADGAVAGGSAVSTASTNQPASVPPVVTNALDLQAAAQALAKDIGDWSAWSTGSEVKAHLLKTFFMQDYLGAKSHVSR